MEGATTTALSAGEVQRASLTVLAVPVMLRLGLRPSEGMMTAYERIVEQIPARGRAQHQAAQEWANEAFRTRGGRR